MTIFKIFLRLYKEHFHWAFDDEFELERTFNSLNDFHDKSLPTSENVMEQYYCKIFKSKAFTLLAPILYLFLKFQFVKYGNAEYLERLIQKSIEAED